MTLLLGSLEFEQLSPYAIGLPECRGLRAGRHVQAYLGPSVLSVSTGTQTRWLGTVKHLLWTRRPCGDLTYCRPFTCTGH